VNYNCGIIDVKELMKNYLAENGYDGLYHDCDCGCSIDDLAPCGHLCLDCTPGYRKDTPGGEFDFIIGPKND